MIGIEYENESVDYCNQCGGLWVDGDEVRHVVGEDFRFSTPEHMQNKVCPRCGYHNFYPVLYPGTEVTVDICEHCYGIWFDPGELQAIRKIVTAATDSQEKEDSSSAKVSSWINTTIAKLLKW